MVLAHIRRLTYLFMIMGGLFSGCGTIDSRTIAKPGTNQFVCTKSGDRFTFQIDEPSADCRWSAICEDNDVEVRVDRVPSPAGSFKAGKADVLIRIHRGFDGPSAIKFFCTECKNGKRSKVKEFTISLYKRTGDAALWK